MTTQPWPVGKGGGMRDIEFLGPLSHWARGVVGPGVWASKRVGPRAESGCSDHVGVAWDGDRTREVVRGGRTPHGLSWRVVMGRVDAIAVGGHNRAAPAPISRRPAFGGES